MRQIIILPLHSSFGEVFGTSADALPLLLVVQADEARAHLAVDNILDFSIEADPLLIEIFAVTSIEAIVCSSNVGVRFEHVEVAAAHLVVGLRVLLVHCICAQYLFEVEIVVAFRKLDDA